MRTRLLLPCLAALALAACGDDASNPTATDETPQLAQGGGQIGINIALREFLTEAQRTELRKFGPILNEYTEFTAVRIRGRATDIPAIQKLVFVEMATPDATREAKPGLDLVTYTDLAGVGRNAWGHDAIDVTDSVGPAEPAREVAYDGTGVVVGVLDSGLLPTWRQYFPAELFDVANAKAFGGGGAGGVNVSEQPNKWEDDVDSHGTHVTSIITGFRHVSGGERFINGAAPKVTIVPVKVLNQNGSGWASTIAAGIEHMIHLKETVYQNRPVVLNMSLGGSVLDAVEKEAIDAAIEAGLIIVATAGNRGPTGFMNYPGAYGPVVSVAAAGWTGEWVNCNNPTSPVEFGAFWRTCDVPEIAGDPVNYMKKFYIASFSSQRDLTKPANLQDLDVAAPGSWVLGPYQFQQGKEQWAFIGGTSQAAPHVTGLIALMAQKKPSLTAAEAEQILESTAIPFLPESRTVRSGFGTVITVPWRANTSGAGLINAPAALAATN